MNNRLLMKLSEINKVPVCKYVDEKFTFAYPHEYIININKKLNILKYIENIVDMPVVLMEDENIFWGMYKNKSNEVIIIGPISKNPITESMRLEYCNRHNLALGFKINRLDIETLVDILILVFELDTDKEISKEEVMFISTNDDIYHWNKEEDDVEYRLEISELDMDHNSIEFENQLLQIVRTGNVKLMDRMIKGLDTLEAEHVGVVAKNSLKQAEYLSVTLITLISRAAVQGGVSVEESYGLADIYLRRLEKAKDVKEMYALASRAEYEFTLIVSESKKVITTFPYIEQCKDYISKNLRKPIQVGDIAPKIGINRSYLARKFSEIEGITIQKYLMQERCEHAGNMLKYSDYSIALIAEYFCFSSQSHFGKIFKEFKSMTPKEYRNKYQGTIDF